MSTNMSGIRTHASFWDVSFLATIFVARRSTCKWKREMYLLVEHSSWATSPHSLSSTYRLWCRESPWSHNAVRTCTKLINLLVSMQTVRIGDIPLEDSVESSWENRLRISPDSLLHRSRLSLVGAPQCAFRHVCIRRPYTKISSSRLESPVAFSKRSVFIHVR